MTQPSGTSAGFAGNAWASRMSVLDICEARDNAHFASANYAYELCDAAHLNATSKALIGEALGCQINNALLGPALPATKLVRAQMEGHTIDLTFDGPNGIKLAPREIPVPITPHGFAIDGRTEQMIKKVQQTGTHTLRLHCKLPVSETQGELRYAFARNAGGLHEDETLFPFGRGSLCEDWEAKSAIVPRKRLRRWVPGFALCLTKVAQKELVA